MPMRSVTGRPIDYFLINGSTPSGATLGRLGDTAIREFVTDVFGKRYRYVGLAPRTWRGELDVDALKDGEFILAPNLLYCLERTPRRNDRGPIARFLASMGSSGPVASR